MLCGTQCLIFLNEIKHNNRLLAEMLHTFVHIVRKIYKYCIYCTYIIQILYILYKIFFILYTNIV
jgi:hypothetical protein